MTPEALHIIERLLKAAIFVPVMALAAWWILSNWMDGTLTPREAVVGFALVGAAFLLGVLSIIAGGWGFLGVIGLLYVAVLGIATWEYLYWRRREKEHLLSEIEKYEQAIERDGTNAAAYSFLGEAHLKLRHFEEAAAAFEKALALSPESKRDRKLLKQAQQRRGPSKWRRLD